MLKGKKINLVRISKEDTDLIIKWRNSVKENFIFREDLTRSIHEAWLKEKIDTGKAVQFIMIENKTGRKVGSVYLRDINREHHNAEFGIFIGEDNARGIGYGSEAAEILTEYGFRKLGLHRIFLRVLENNKRAIKSYLKAGYEIEGTARDMVLFAGGGIKMLFSCLEYHKMKTQKTMTTTKFLRPLVVQKEHNIFSNQEVKKCRI